MSHSAKHWTELISLGYRRETAGYEIIRPGGQDNLLIIHTLSGAGWAGRREQVLEKGDTLIFMPHCDQEYGIYSESHWEIRWAHVRPRARWTPWLDWPVAEGWPGLKITRGPSYAERIGQALQDALEISRAPMPEAEALAMTRLEECLLWSHARCGDNPPIDERLQPALLHVTRDPEKVVSVDELARRCGLSPSRFAHLFREQIGHPPHRFQEQIRMRMAADLLLMTNESVQEIAERCGYEDPLYFSRRFKAVQGTSPRSHRSNTR